MSKNGEVSSNQGKPNVLSTIILTVCDQKWYIFLKICIYFTTGPSRPTMPKPELSLLGSDKRKVLDLQIGGPSGDGVVFVPFNSSVPVPRPRPPARTIRDVLPENARLVSVSYV